MESLKLALGQVQGSPIPAVNLETAERMVREAASLGSNLVVFPEMFMALPQRNQSLVQVAESLDGPFVAALALLASRHHLHVICGVWEPSQEPGRVYNTAVMISPQGKLLASYHKLHLFDALDVRESERMVHGGALPPLVTVNNLGIGIAICYDLRFPELFRNLAQRGAHVVIVPSAWYSGPLKEDHWLTLLRARAIENTMFTAGVNLAGATFCGRSSVFDPFGVPVAGGGEDQQLLVATVTLERVREVRTKLPSLTHCRMELFEKDVAG